MAWVLSDVLLLVASGLETLPTGQPLPAGCVVPKVRSARFNREVIVTNHARQRMRDRGIDETVLGEVVETGDLVRVDQEHLFIFKYIAGRRDNLVCAAAVEEAALVIKTVMVNWILRETP